MTTPQVLQVGNAASEVVTRLLGDAVEMIERFTQVAIGDPFDPLQFLLLLIGGLIVAVSSLAIAWLSVGGLFGWFFRFAG